MTNKGLEAFNRIKSYFHPKQLLTKEMTLNDLDTIEKALKRLEELEEEKQSFDRQLEKELKALEIIKEKQVDVSCLLFDGLELYNENMHPNRVLTQEEYDLLKEVLL